MKTRTLVSSAVAAALIAISGPAWAQYAVRSPYAVMPFGGYYAAPGVPPFADAPMAPTGQASALIAAQAPNPMPADSTTAETGQSACGSLCGNACGCVDGCCSCGWTHRFAAFGEFLYLRARDADVAYAVEMNGPITSPPDVPIQVSPLAVVDHDFDPGFRAGFSLVCGEDTSLTACYTMFETSSADEILQNPANPTTVIRSMVSHPSTFQAAFDDLEARANQDISFDLIDVDFRDLFASGPDFKACYLLGVRYATLEQEFSSAFGINGSRTVATDIDFDGVGLRMGVEGERYSRSRRFMVYARGVANVLAGEFNGTYAQGQSYDASEVATGWEAGRLAPVLEVEVGGGWTSRCGTWRLLAGYVFTTWTNFVKTDDFIQAVQQNSFVDLSDDLTFDGLVARFEGRF